MTDTNTAQLTEKEVKLVMKIIDNLEIYTSDENYFEMLDDETDNGNPNFEKDILALRNSLRTKLNKN
jgi:hypothetical protein